MTSPTSSTDGSLNILSIDTSGPLGSLALGSHFVQWEKKAIHSEIATIKLQELLSQANLKLTDISFIVVNAGPGSFTGIRVGVNLARTLAYALSIPISTLNTLELLAFTHGQPTESVFIAIKAIQNFYYVAGYDFGEKGLAQRLAPISLDESEVHIQAATYQKVLIEGFSEGFLPNLDARAALRWLDRWPDSTIFSTWKEVRPVYIRASEAEEKLLKGLLKA